MPAFHGIQVIVLCADTMCSNISQEVQVRLCRRLQFFVVVVWLVFFILFPLQTCECYDSRISLVMFVVWYAFSNLLVCTPDLMSLSDSSSLAQWSTSAPDSNGHSSKQASSIKWITNGFSCFSAASSNKKRTLKNSSFFRVRLHGVDSLCTCSVSFSLICPIISPRGSKLYHNHLIILTSM